MTDKDLNQEDELILDLVDRVDDGERSPGQGQTSSGALEREYREVLGLLAYESDEVTPGPQVRQRILDSVGTVPEVGSAELSRPAPHNWLLPMAASVALVLMAVTGWLVVQVRLQQVRITELSAELGEARAQTAALASSEGLLTELRSRLALVATPGAQFCALKPPAGSDAREAVGVVVMHPVREQWFLRVEGLAPCSQGRKYMVWFATDDGTAPGPLFAVKADGEAVELTVDGRPDKINAIMITLEAEPAPAEPSMEPLLFGDERMQVF